MSKPSDNNTKDPRFRPYRVAMYVLYITLCAIFCVLVIVSVVRSTLEMTPRRKSESDITLTVRECLDGAQTLWQDLDSQRKALTSVYPASNADDLWSKYRVQWLRRLRELDAKCATDSKAREPLRQLFRRLDQVQDLFTTHAVQYAGEVGSSVDSIQDAFERVRAEMAAGKLP